jgi:hypothetical protein
MYETLYMCKILVPAVRFGAYFKMYTPCCCSLWSASHKRCLKANVGCFESVAWISLVEFWIPSWVAQMLNGFQMCIKNYISQWTLGCSVCCGEVWVWKANKTVLQICFLPYTLDYMCEVRKQVQEPRQCFSTKALVQIRYRLSEWVLKHTVIFKCMLGASEPNRVWPVACRSNWAQASLSVITINVVQ